MGTANGSSITTPTNCVLAKFADAVERSVRSEEARKRAEEAQRVYVRETDLERKREEAVESVEEEVKQVKQEPIGSVDRVQCVAVDTKPFPIIFLVTFCTSVPSSAPIRNCYDWGTWSLEGVHIFNLELL